jgi:hypothetical protein
VAFVLQPVVRADNTTTVKVAGVISVKAGGVGPTQLAVGVAKTQRGTYVGTGALKSVAMTFRPQLIILGVVGDATRVGYVFDGQTNQETGLRGTTLVASTDVDTTSTGFDLAAASPFNTAATTYYWIAFGGAT